MTTLNPCAPYEERLTSWLLEELNEDEASAVARHVDGCEPCREEVRVLKQTLDLLQAGPVAGSQSVLSLGAARRADILRRTHRARVRHVIFVNTLRVAAVFPIVALLAALMMPAGVAHSRRGGTIGRLEVSMMEPEPEGVAVGGAVWDNESLPQPIQGWAKDAIANDVHPFGGQAGERAGSPRSPRPAERASETFAYHAPMSDSAPVALPEPGPPIPATVPPPPQPRLARSRDTLERLEQGQNQHQQAPSGQSVHRLSRETFASATVEDRAPEGPAPARLVAGMPPPAVVDAPRATGVRGDLAESALDGRRQPSDEEIAYRRLPSFQVHDKSDEVPSLIESGMVSVDVSRMKETTPGRTDRDSSEGAFKGELGLDLELLEKDDSGRQADGKEEEDNRDKRRPDSPADEPLDPSIFRASGVNPIVPTVDQAFSTFGIDVDTASYTLTRSRVRAGVLPPAEAVRTEEFVNFFDYGYRAPKGDTFAIHVDRARTPFSVGSDLLMIGVKGRRIGREEQRNAVLTFVVDTSGSMETPERIGLVRLALRELIGQLGPDDRVSIIQVGSRARLVAEAVPASEKETLQGLLDALQVGGSTHLEEGLQLGYQVAARTLVAGAENRVLLLSDGMANLGSDDPVQLLNQVSEFRKQGVYLSVFGFGMGSYNDALLEKLANSGDGAYQFIDSAEEVRRVFVEELAATLNTIAADVKIQVEFNPRRVRQWRQLGYENRRLTREQFRDDTVDAGEVGSGQSVTALYEISVTGDDSEPLGIVRVRYRESFNGPVREIERRMGGGATYPRFEEAAPAFRLAAAAAEYAEILRDSPFAADGTLEDVARVLRPVSMEMSLDPRVRELLGLVERSRGLPRSRE